MNERSRPVDARTAHAETTKSRPANLNRPAADTSDRTVALVAGAFARSWEMLAACRRDFALIEQRKREG